VQPVGNPAKKSQTVRSERWRGRGVEVGGRGWWKYMGGIPKIGGKPPNWMVNIMENPIKMG